MREGNDTFLSASLKNWAANQNPPGSDLHTIIRQARINKALAPIKKHSILPERKNSAWDRPHYLAAKTLRLFNNKLRSVTSSNISRTETYNIASSIHLANSLRSVS